MSDPVIVAGHVWEFRPKPVDAQTYSDGTTVPHLMVPVFRDGAEVGYVEIHLHKTRDGHVSFGFTGVVYRGNA